MTCGSELRSLPVLALDCQSTGATPEHGALLEIGWAAGDEPASYLVRLPPDVRIPAPVQRITGITHACLDAHARDVADVWSALRASARGVASEAGTTKAATVIHFASFELRFLEQLHREHGTGEFPFAPICTHEIARRLFPDLPRRGIRALAGYFGVAAGPLRRSADHVRATSVLWRALVEELAQRGVTTVAALASWMEQPVERRPRGWPMPRSERSDLPDAPGVYRMRRIDGSLLYVGKARSLKRRVGSYFQRRRGANERLLEMLTQARKLSVTPTETAVEAALLEHDEIKAHAPPYNVALRADHEHLSYATHDLCSIAARADARHAIGPVRDGRVFRGMAALAEGIARIDGDPAELLALSPAWAPERALFVEGIRELRARHAIEEGSLRQLLALGSRCFRRESEEEEMERTGWTVEGIVSAIEDRFARAAHAIRRARWLAIFAEASLAWTERDRRRVLVLARGRVVAAAWTHEIVPPLPPGAWTPSAHRRVMDLAAYDRLRVLTTELRRLIADGVNPVVRTGAGSRIDAASLARLLDRI